MTQDGAVRAYELRGDRAAEALDWLHVHTELQGAMEGDDCITVWLAGPLPELPQPEVAVREIVVAAADLAVTGLEQDTAIAIADDLIVRPPWVARPAHFTGIELVVPRGGAFGSGEHDSTKVALRCLHRLWDAPSSFVDVGTGSGILALYAQVRGCPHIQACDIEEPSVLAARELLPAATVLLGGPELLAPAAGVIANMTASELRAAMPAILGLWTRERSLVLSGLRADEVDAVVGLVPAPIAWRETSGAFTAVGFRGLAGPRPV